MKNFRLCSLALVALTSCFAACKPESVPVEKPGKPSAINVEILEDKSAQLTVEAVANADKYDWFMDGDKVAVTEEPAYIAVKSGNYKVAAENAAGMGEFSDEVEVIVPLDMDNQNLLQARYIPDEKLRSWIKENIANGSDVYTIGQAASRQGKIDLSFVYEIESLEGISYFSSLDSLYYEDAKDLKKTGFEGMSNLKFLFISDSKVGDMDITSLTSLKKAFLQKNKSANLNVKGLENLTLLYCDGNSLTSLDLSGCNSLKEIACSYNSLQSITLPENSAIEVFASHSNPDLKSLDLGKLSANIKHLSLSKTGITSYDLSGMTNLEYLGISENYLTESPDFSACPNLKELGIEQNQIANMDLSPLTKLELLNAYENNLQSLDLTNNTELNWMNLQDNALETLNISGLAKFTYMNIARNCLDNVDVSSSTSLNQFYCNGNHVAGDANTAKTVRVKVWDSFDIANAYANGFYIDSTVELYKDGGDVQEKAAEIGDIVYSDGTWSSPSEIDYTKTPVAIVFQNDPSRIGDAEKAALKELGIETPHGLAISLLEIPSTYTYWACGEMEGYFYVHKDIEGIQNYSEATKYHEDINGLANSKAVWAEYSIDDPNNPYPIFTLTKQFGASAPAPEKSTDWFVPAFGQIWDMFSNLGKIENDLKNNDYSYGDIYVSVSTGLYKTLNAWTEKILPAHKKDYAKEFSFWTSSEYNSDNVLSWSVNDDIVSGAYADKRSQSISSVRPVFAF